MQIPKIINTGETPFKTVKLAANQLLKPVTSKP